MYFVWNYPQFRKYNIKFLKFKDINIEDLAFKGEFVLILEKNIKSVNLDISMYKEKITNQKMVNHPKTLLNL